MRTPWIMNRPGPEENRKAAAVAVGLGAAIGAVAFYFVRIFLARERIEPVKPVERVGRRGRAVERRSGEGEEE